MAISCRLAPASIKKLCHCEPVRTLAWQSVLPIPLSLRGSESRGNLLSVGSCVYQKTMSLRATKWRGNLLSVSSRFSRPPLSLRGSKSRGNPYPLSPCHCEARRAVAISCRLVPASIEIPCHCEPVRTLAWQSVTPVIARVSEATVESVPPIPLSLRGSKSRGNLLSVGSCVYQKTMSLRASAHTGSQ